MEKRNILNNKLYTNIIYLINCALNNEKVDDDFNDGELLSLAKGHRLSALVASAFKKPNSKWEKAYFKAIRRETLFEQQRKEVTQAFSEEKIWYCLLKGIIMKDYYPKGYLREMSDNDILIDETKCEEIKKIMSEKGYRYEHDYGEHHDVYVKEPIFKFELHRSLISEEKEKEFFEYFKDINKRLIKDENNEYEYHLSKEDFYIYSFVHTYHHYVYNGAGIRHLIDIYLYTSKNELDWNYINNELEKLGILEKERTFRKIAYKLFSTFEELTEEEKEQLEFMFISCVHGSYKSRIMIMMAKDKENNKNYRFKYLRDRLLLDDAYLKERYPFFYKHRVALPLLTVYRLFRGLFKGHGRLKWEIKNFVKNK